MENKKLLTFENLNDLIWLQKVLHFGSMNDYPNIQYWRLLKYAVIGDNDE